MTTIKYHRKRRLPQSQPVLVGANASRCSVYRRCRIARPLDPGDLYERGENIDLAEELLLDEIHRPVEHQEEERYVEVDHFPSTQLYERRDGNPSPFCESG